MSLPVALSENKIWYGSVALWGNGVIGSVEALVCLKTLTKLQVSYDENMGKCVEY